MGAITGSPACSRGSRRSACRSVWSRTIDGSCARRGRCDENLAPGLRHVLRCAGDLAGRRDEARRPRDGGRHACGAGRVRGLLSLPPRAREAHGGHRARDRMVRAPEAVENMMTHWLGLPPLASAHGAQIDNLIGWTHVFMLILFV